MASIGERLRRAREEQGRSLTDVAAETCITSRYLAAIEADNPKPVPGEFFYRNWVKQYADALRIDSTSFARELDALFPVESDDIPAPVSSGRSSSFLVWRGAVAAVLLLAGIAGGSGLYTRRSGEPQAVNGPAAAAVATPPVEETSPTQSAAAASNGLRIAATEATWISIWSNGRTVFRGVMQPSETREFAGMDSGKLLTGNAAGVAVAWNGKALGPLGARGQVRMVLLEPENYRIVSPNRI